MIHAIDGHAPASEEGTDPFRGTPAGLASLVASRYGLGGLLAVAIWCELGDCQRSSGQSNLSVKPGHGVELFNCVDDLSLFRPPSG